VTAPLYFVPFTERNEWEGETWTFWLQLNGNELRLAFLEAYLEHENDVDERFMLDLDTVNSFETVASACQSARYRSGYMLDTQMICGSMQLCIPSNLSVLYKGGIRGYFNKV
jgi:hypothetical protein